MPGFAIKTARILLAIVVIVIVGRAVRERIFKTPFANTSKNSASISPTPSSAPPSSPQDASSFRAEEIAPALSNGAVSLELEELRLSEGLTVGGSASFGGGLTIAGNKIINSAGKIPALNGGYFADLDGENITNVNAHHLGGKAASSFLRSDEPDTAEAVITFTASPGSTDVSGGGLFINPAAAQAEYTLFGIAVGGTNRLRFDAEGDLSLSGNITLDGGIDTATTMRAGTGDGFTVDANGNITKINGVTYLFPSSQGTAGSLLINDGSGALSWGALGSAAITADSLDFPQFEDALDLDANLTINATANNYSLNFDSNTMFVDTANNRIGIGSASPDASLDILGTGGQQLRLSYTDGSVYSGIGVDASGNLTVMTTGSSVAFSGDTVSATDFSCADCLDFGELGDALALDASTDIAITGANALSITNTGSSTSFVVNDQASDTSPFVIDANGNVGIGTTNPTLKLEVNGTAAASLFRGGNNGAPNAVVFGVGNEADTGMYGVTTNTLNFATDGTERIRISPTGNVGIATGSFGTNAAKVLALGNGTAPTTSIVDGIQLWAEDIASSSELRVRDEAGNVTTLSPHNFSLLGSPSEDMAWSYYSERGDLAVSADMTCALRLVEQLSGQKIVRIKNRETGEDVSATSDCSINPDQQVAGMNVSDDATSTLNLIASNLTVLGDAVLPDTVINGKLTVGIIELDNSEGSVNAIGTLSIQPLALGAVDFLSGKVIFDTSGNISLTAGVLKGNDKMRGTIELEAWQTSVEVEQDWDSTPVSVTVTPSYDTYLWVSHKDSNGFTLHVKTPPTEPQTMDWWAVW
jgi:hypothetical protein